MCSLNKFVGMSICLANGEVDLDAFRKRSSAFPTATVRTALSTDIFCFYLQGPVSSKARMSPFVHSPALDLSLKMDSSGEDVVAEVGI